jgi:hypothetical protein
MNISRQNAFKITIQLIGWGILFAIPLFFAPENMGNLSLMLYLEYIFVPISFMFIFYINYFLFIERFLLKRKSWPTFVLVNGAIILCMVYGLHLLHEAFMAFKPDIARKMDFPDRAIGFMFRDGIALSLTAGLAVAVRMTGNWYNTEYERKELEKAKTEAELNNLKDQLNPHFLFNTLNNIYSLIAIDSVRAQDAVHGLSHLLRYALYENNNSLVPLNKEVKFIRSYIELMSIRLGSTFHCKVSLPDESSALVAPMLLITLVENAFKHGVHSTKSSFIHIDLAVDDKGILRFVVVNSNYASNSNGNSGIGIGNLKKRLGLLYPQNHTLILENNGQTFTAILTLNTNTPTHES